MTPTRPGSLTTCGRDFAEDHGALSAHYSAITAFAGLRECGLFQSAKVENGTVVWHEEIDLPPDTLYFRGKVVQWGHAAPA